MERLNGRTCTHAHGDAGHDQPARYCHHPHSPCAHAAAAPITGVRLANGSEAQGAVQVQLAGVALGSVCGFSTGGAYNPHTGPDHDIATATVICRTLGHTSGEGLLLPSGAFGRNDGPFVLVLSIDGCSGNETNLSQCSVEYTPECAAVSARWAAGAGLGVAGGV